MPRILFLAPASSIHTVRWANALARHGYDVRLLSLQPVHQLLDAQVRYYGAPYAPRWGYVANWPWARALMARLEPDLVHAHYATGYGTLAALAGFHPTILSVWGTDVYEFPHHSFLHRRLLQYNLSRADKLLSTSHAMAKAMGKYTGKQIEVTPFGVDLSQFSPQRVDSLFEAGAIVIGTVKTLDEKYGIKYLIQAFSLLKQRQPTLPLKLLIVGSGPQEAYLKNLAGELNVGGDTRFTGHIRHDEIAKHYNMLTIFVSISVSESFGVAVIEACACEKAVVVSNVGGLPEVVEDDVSGIVVEPRNPEDQAGKSWARKGEPFLQLGG
jgi:glycosyltransferase involved in cell wall biosynthesis